MRKDLDDDDGLESFDTAGIVFDVSGLHNVLEDAHNKGHMGEVYIESGWGVYRRIGGVKVDGAGNVYLECVKGR